MFFDNEFKDYESTRDGSVGYNKSFEMPKSLDQQFLHKL